MASGKAGAISNNLRRRKGRVRAICCTIAHLAASPAAADPDAIAGEGNNPSAGETFQRGKALALEPGLGVVVFPVPIANPTIGTGLGLGAGVLYQLDEGSTPSYSSIGGLATSNRTWGVGALQYLSLDEDRYRISFGLGYASVRYDFFGAGSGAGDRDASIPIHQNGYFTNPSVEVRIDEDLYIGLQYRFIEARTQIDATDRHGSIGNLLDGRQADFISSGIGPVLDWDTRDDPFWPHEGHLLHAQALFASGELLSDFDYRKGQIAFNYFHENFEQGVLAARAAGCFSGGEVPVLDLCLFGAKHDLRGYEIGRYRDKTALALQLEQRWKFAERWGLVAFAGAGSIGSSFAETLDSELLASGGFGLRFQASRDYQVHLAIDGAINLEGDTSLYFRIGEAF